MTELSEVEMVGDGQKALKVGPSRDVLLAEEELLEKLGLREEPTVSSWKLVLMVELLLLAGIITRLVSMSLNGQLDNLTNITFGKDGIGMKENDMDSLTNVHIITSMIGHVFVVPQLVMLVLVAKESVTVVIQFVLALLLQS